MKEKLTEHRIAGYAFKDKSFTVHDTQVIGFFVEVNKVSKSFKIQAELWSGPRGRRTLTRSIRHTLARVGELPLDVARSRAMGLLGRIKDGEDPFAEVPKPTILTVTEAFTSYAERCRAEERSDRTIEDLDRFLGYLNGWGTLPLPTINKAMAREKHAALVENVGAVSANKALRQFRAVWNHINKTRDWDLGPNPVLGVTFKKERAKNRSIEPDDLALWFSTVQKLPNPQRRAMHEFALFTGLRPGNVITLERAWVRLPERAIVIPAERMKARREFTLPLSDHLVGLVERILTLSEMQAPGSTWLFPTRNMQNEVTHTQCWKERTLPSETGHILRHTYSNMAMLAGVTGDDRQLLMAQSVAGVRGVYLHTPVLWTRLLAEQERVSRFLLGKVQP